MASSKTDISNLALGHLAIDKDIANLDTERSEEANACRKFYELARTNTLRGFNWPFATKFADLGLVEADPTDEWGFSYQYPSDCIFFRRIPSGIRNDSLQSKAKYRLGTSSSGTLIYTDVSDAKCEYTADIDDVSFFSDDFVEAMSYRLAKLVAKTLTGGDPFKLGERADADYRQCISEASASAFNEEANEEPVQSEFIRIREGDPE